MMRVMDEITYDERSKSNKRVIIRSRADLLWFLLFHATYTYFNFVIDHIVIYHASIICDHPLRDLL
jgi:hypothetical protein